MKELWLKIDSSISGNQKTNLLDIATQTCDVVLVDANETETVKKFGIKTASISTEANIIVLSVFDQKQLKLLKAKGKTVAVKIISSKLPV